MAGGIQGNIDDLKNPKLWRAVAAEFIGTLLLVIVGCGTCIGDAWESPAVTNPTTVQISLAFGLIVATVVWSIAHVSGGHVNPAVTMGMLVARKITLVRALLYIPSQSFGAVVGAGILKGVHIEDASQNETYGLTTVNTELKWIQGFGIEFIITFILVFCVFSCCDKKRTDLNGSAPLTIGLAVAVCHLFAIKYTGSSMNPARTFGPAVIGNRWDKHEVYWFGPIMGGIGAALLYELVFSADSSLAKMKRFFTVADYDDDAGEYEVNPEKQDEGKKQQQQQQKKDGDAEAAV